MLRELAHIAIFRDFTICAFNAKNLHQNSLIHLLYMCAAKNIIK
jgi:hypothetical protein